MSEASGQKTKEAADTVERLEKDLGAMRQRLESIVAQPATPPEVRGRIATLSAEVAGSIGETGRVGESLRSNLQAQEALIQKVAPERLERLRRIPREPPR